MFKQLQVNDPESKGTLLSALVRLVEEADSTLATDARARTLRLVSGALSLSSEAGKTFGSPMPVDSSSSTVAPVLSSTSDIPKLGLVEVGRVRVGPVTTCLFADGSRRAPNDAAGPLVLPTGVTHSARTGDVFFSETVRCSVASSEVE